MSVLEGSGVKSARDVPGVISAAGDCARVEVVASPRVEVVLVEIDKVSVAEGPPGGGLS